MARPSVSAALGLCLLLAVQPARAQNLRAAREPEPGELVVAPLPSAEPSRLEWRWPRFRQTELYVTGVAALTAVGFQLLKPDDTRWRGGILVDEDARGTLALRTYGQRRAARDASDVLIASLISYPILVDGVIVANWHYQSEDVMWQMFLINAEVYAVTAAVQSATAGLTSRERPYARTCGADLSAESRDCQSSTRYRSFFSGHSAMAFASAGLICSHHANLELYGGGVADDLTCAAGLAAAAATGALRAMGDVHYVSDVTTGALVGAGVGFGLPWLLHYRTPLARRRVRPVSFTLEPRPLVGETWGAGVGGRF